MPDIEMGQAQKQRAVVTQEYGDKLDYHGGFRHSLEGGEFGYESKELDTLPEDATENSFGCGNPFAFAKVEPGSTVVDLGSGAGMDVILAAQRTGASGKVIGVDMTDKMVEKARQSIQQAGVDQFAEVRLGMIESLPVESQSADWVISNCVLSLSPQKEKVFSEIERILKPGGKMVISDIVIGNVPLWIKLLARLYSPTATTLVNESEYIAGLRQAGLTNVRIEAKLEYDEISLRALLSEEIGSTLGFRELIRHGNRQQMVGFCLKPMVALAAKQIANGGGKHIEGSGAASIRIAAEKPL